MIISKVKRELGITDEQAINEIKVMRLFEKEVIRTIGEKRFKMIVQQMFDRQSEENANERKQVMSERPAITQRANNMLSMQQMSAAKWGCRVGQEHLLMELAEHINEDGQLDAEAMQRIAKYKDVGLTPIVKENMTKLGLK